MPHLNGNGLHKLSSSPQPSSGLRSESSDYEGVSLGTHSTRFSQLSPSNDISLKRFSDRSNPPPSPAITDFESYSVFSDNEPHVPPAPAPSINYETMSGISDSVSRRGDLPVNGVHGPHRLPPGYHHINHHHPHHQHQQPPPYDHHSAYTQSRYSNLPLAHYGRSGGRGAAPLAYPLHNLDSQSESESTFSFSTVNTGSHDIFHYDSVHDVTPPGRPPSPATVVSEHRLPDSPASPVSESELSDTSH